MISFNFRLFFSFNLATYKYCCRGVYCPGCPVHLYLTFAEQKILVHRGLAMDCQERNFNRSLETLVQEGTYKMNVSGGKIKVPSFYSSNNKVDILIFAIKNTIHSLSTRLFCRWIIAQVYFYVLGYVCLSGLLVLFFGIFQRNW